MEEEALGEIKICVNEDAKYGPNDMFNKRLNMSVSTWMKLYHNLVTPDARAEYRIVTTPIVKTFRHEKTIISKHGTFVAKFESSEPYNFFLSTVDELEETAEQPFSVSFHEILDHTGGEIVDSLHLNYMVELMWVVTEYMLAGQDPKMTILYGTLVDPQYVYEIPFDIKLIKVEMPEYGSHHSKISILKYKDESIRMIISTANYYYLDWKTRTQGLWISPRLPHLPEDAKDTDGESVTNFKKDFIAYLGVYKAPEVLGWQALMRRTDFSAVKVFFLPSVPGNYDGPQAELYGHKKLYAILSEHAVMPYTAREWPIVAQSSAIGVFGQEYHGWLQNQIAHPMAREKDKRIIYIPEFKFIYPSQACYSQSFDSQIGATCLMYNEHNHQRQPWIKNFLHDWKSDIVGRTRAMPHCKCYTRISPDGTEIPWFVLTSANISKGAWGKLVKGGVSNYTNYEAGVVFIPEIMINQTTFPVKKTENTTAPLFLLPYDLPLNPYKLEDEPFVIASPKEPIPSTDKLEEQEKPQKYISVEELAMQLKALKQDAEKEKTNAHQLILGSSKSQDPSVTENSEKSIKTLSSAEAEKQNIDNINNSIEVIEDSEEISMSTVSSEVGMEDEEPEDKESARQHDLFASV